MTPCLLCDPASEPRGSGDAPICSEHPQHGRAAFEAAEPLLRSHLEQAHGAELDEWVRRGVLPGLAWHLLTREARMVSQPDGPPRPGRPLRFGRDSDAAVRLLRELVVSALAQEVPNPEPAALLKAGMPNGNWTASVDLASTHAAWEALIAQLVTVDRVEAALKGLPIEAAARAVIDASIEGETKSDELVTAMGVLSLGAQTLALVRRMSVGESMLVDPVEVADQPDAAGSGEFTCGWWEIRTTLAEPARQWVELLEGRFPRARRR